MKYASRERVRSNVFTLSTPAVLAPWHIRSKKTTRFSNGCAKEPAQLLEAAQACFERFNQRPQNMLSVIDSKAKKVR